VFVFEDEGGHFVYGPAVEHGDLGGSETAGGAGGIYCRVACSDYYYAIACGDWWSRFVSGDVAQGVDYVWVVFALDSEGIHAAEAVAKENGVVFFADLLEARGIDGFIAADFYAEGFDEFHFADGVGHAEFVFGYSVCIQASG
jgi:hypothetical protein